MLHIGTACAALARHARATITRAAATASLHSCSCYTTAMDRAQGWQGLHGIAIASRLQLLGCLAAIHARHSLCHPSLVASSLPPHIPSICW